MQEIAWEGRLNIHRCRKHIIWLTEMGNNFSWKGKALERILILNQLFAGNIRHLQRSLVNEAFCCFVHSWGAWQVSLLCPPHMLQASAQVISVSVSPNKISLVSHLGFPQTLCSLKRFPFLRVSQSLLGTAYFSFITNVRARTVSFTCAQMCDSQTWLKSTVLVGTPFEKYLSRFPR